MNKCLWEVGSKRPVGINIEKAWNLFLPILYSEVLENLVTRINNECPRRYVHRCEDNELNTPRGIYRSLALGYESFQFSEYQNKRQ